MLDIGYLNLDNPVVIISSKEDFDELRSFDESVGLLMLGSFDLEVVSASEIEKAIDEMSPSSALGLSVAGGSREKLMEVSLTAAKRGCLLEIDLSTHSQLDAVTSLARDMKRTGVVLSVRFRPEFSVDLGEIAEGLSEAGVDVLHLDLTGQNGAALKLVKKMKDRGAPHIMARFDIGDFEGAKSILSMGADLVSLNGRTDPEFASWLVETLKEFGRLTGWYNAPKHICAGGDLRGMAFCCPPVKNCPLMGALKKVGMTPKQFLERKMMLAKGTPLEYGEGTCFGSLVWCCKVTKPCFMRDAVLDRIGLSPSDYMKLKKKLAEDLLES